MSLVVVCGALANKPGNGGAAWTRLSWALGLRRLGCDVYFVEQIAPGTCLDETGAPCDVDRSINLAYFRHVMERFGMDTASALIVEDTKRSFGLEWAELVALANDADLLVNISGHLTIDTLKPRFRTRAFIDLDPGYTQFWDAQALTGSHVRDHDVYFSVGENIGKPGCDIPDGGIEWRPIRQPVLLDEWPVVASVNAPTRFTTVASWRGPFGRVKHDQREFGLKAHEFRKFMALPTVSDHAFEVALELHAADERDAQSLRRSRWTVVDPKLVAGDPFAFRQYVQRSSAEFSVAQGIYVETQSGWFSDRTVRYLASGKPALVQDTGFSRNYPVGNGLLSFRTIEDAARGADRIAGEYERHSRAARALAEEFFDSDKVLKGLLRTIEDRS